MRYAATVMAAASLSASPPVSVTVSVKVSAPGDGAVNVVRLNVGVKLTAARAAHPAKIDSS